MSRKKIITFTVLSILLILTIFYVFFSSKPEEFIEASQDEIDVWALENNVNILKSVNVQNDMKPYVLALYENEQKYGIYQLEKRKNELTHTNVLSTVKNTQPIQVLGIRSGVPVVFLIFNDQDLLNRGDNLEIFIGSKRFLQQIEHERNIYSITYNSDDGSFSEHNITIYDKEGNIIFEDFSKKEINTDVDLYNLYYSLASKDVLTGISVDEVKKASSIIQAFDIKKNLDSNSLGLFDLWLYTKINRVLGLNENYKTEIIDYLYQLQTEKGFFLAYIDDDPSNHIGTSYILPTKMALDIFESLDQPLSKVDESRMWFAEIFEELLELDNYDPVTVGDYIGLLNEMDSIYHKRTGEWMLSDFQYSTLFNKINKDLLNSKLSIDKMYTIAYLKEFMNEFEKGNDFLSYTQKVQLKDGSFPVFGVDGLDSDIYTTYLFLWVFKEMDLEIPNRDILSSYLKKRIEVIDINVY